MIAFYDSTRRLSCDACFATEQNDTPRKTGSYNKAFRTRGNCFSVFGGAVRTPQPELGVRAKCASVSDRQVLAAHDGPVRSAGVQPLPRSTTDVRRRP